MGFYNKFCREIHEKKEITLLTDFIIQDLTADELKKDMR